VIDKMLDGLGVTAHEVKKYKSLVYYKRNDKVIFAKPQTFMNSSGDGVKIVRDQYKVKPSNIYIIHDDLDIALGEYKIQQGKGPRDHGGIESIDNALGTKDYWRVRIGVENREGRVDSQRAAAPLLDPQTPKSASTATHRSTSGSNYIPGKDYVLQNFLPGEQEVVDRVILEVVKELEDAYKRRNTA